MSLPPRMSIEFHQGKRIHTAVSVSVIIRLSRLSLPLSRPSSKLGTPDPASSQQSLPITCTVSPSPPWQAWTPDQDFLHEVKEWNETHPENTVDRILSGTCALIDRHQDLLELVPDGTIPIRGFVKVLFRLIYLGAVRHSDRHCC